MGSSLTSFVTLLSVFYLKHLLRRNTKRTRNDGAGGGEDVVDAGDERGVVQLTGLGEEPVAVQQTHFNSRPLDTRRTAVDGYKSSCHSLALEDH